MASQVRIIGIDCAVRAASVGVALATIVAGRMKLDAVRLGTGKLTLREAMAVEIAKLIDDASTCIVALDAPLGWPAELAHGLTHHQAGARLGRLGDADKYMYRRTDEVVFENLGSWPLAVGANYIARTAFAALELLDALRADGRRLPLLWSPGDAGQVGVIEVYPKATLLARKLEVAGYKSAEPMEAETVRRRLLRKMAEEVTIPAKWRKMMMESDHALDAVACTVAAKDFLDGNVVAPGAEDLASAKKEGWIWFRKP